FGEKNVCIFSQLRYQRKIISSQETPRGVGKECGGASRVIEIQGRKRIPRMRKSRMGEDGLAIPLGIL
ncbi:MAG: hypothetical protein VST67_08300, partial [Nitrospirota bacterium]|nr:hypothetical protein [Nitrospirota bacterium]